MNYLTIRSRFIKKWRERPIDEKSGVRKIFGDLYEYNGLGDYYSVCCLRIEIVGNAWHILMTEVVDNPGTTVTNGAEIIATKVYSNLMEIHGERAPLPNDIFWYAYHEHGKYSLDIVRFVWLENEKRFDDPCWVTAKENPFGID